MSKVTPCSACRGMGWTLDCYTVEKDHDAWPAIKFRRGDCDSCGGTGLANDDDAESLEDRRSDTVGE